MTYDKTNWVDGVTPVSAQNMNKLETQYDKAKELVDAHKAEIATQEKSGHMSVQQVAKLEGIEPGAEVNRVHVTGNYTYALGILNPGQVVNITIPTSIDFTDFKVLVKGDRGGGIAGQVNGQKYSFAIGVNDTDSWYTNRIYLEQICHAKVGVTDVNKSGTNLVVTVTNEYGGSPDCGSISIYWEVW